MASLRTENAVKSVIALKGEAIGKIGPKRNGNHVIYFTDLAGKQIARFTLRQIIAKRYPRKKKNKT